MASIECGKLLWCCGSLQSGAVTVGVADLIIIFLLLGQYLESIWTQPFGLELVAFVLVMLFLFASSCLMLHGVLKKQRLLLLPWMVLHLGATVGALIYCGVEFDKMKGQRALFIVGSAVQVYFFIIVILHYVELGKLTEWSAVKREQPEGQDLPDLGLENRKNNCLIDLELEEKHDSSRSSNQDLSFAKDDTFTQLATTRQSNGRAVGDGGAVAIDLSKALPTPDEVISLPTNTKETEDMNNSDHIDALSSNNAAIPRRSTTWKSAATLDDNAAAVESARPDQALLPQTASKSESKILLAHVDNNFSPFRSKSGAAQNGPKMKVFLPNKSSGLDSSASEDNSSSSSEDDKSRGGEGHD